MVRIIEGHSSRCMQEFEFGKLLLIAEGCVMAPFVKKYLPR